MTSQLCECDDIACRATFRTTIELLREIRQDPMNVIISKSCAHGASPGQNLVDEGEEFFIYTEA